MRNGKSISLSALTTALLAALFLTLPLAAQVSINEIRIDQPSGDVDEYFELTGPPGTDLSGYTYLVIGDGTGGSGVIEAVVDLGGQSIPAGGFFVAAETTFTLGTADLTTSLNFENSDNVTHLLVDGFVGSNGADLDTNDDGVLDSTPWSALVDLIALVEEPNPPAGTEYHYGPPTVGPDGPFVPGHVLACPGGFAIGAFGGGDDTPGAANSCPAAALVINEIDYDQSGTDAAEFVEIANVGSAAVDLGGFELQLVNGSGPLVYNSIALPAFSLAPGDYFVVCGDAANTPNCDLDVTPDTNLIQNGSPDAVALVETAGGTIVDTVSYEGDVVGYTEGSGAVADNSSDDDMSISRCPDGSDSDANDVDFDFVASTPGAANDCGPPGGDADLVLNEFQADPDGSLAGDANGDGTRDGSEDEFVEIVNTSGGPLDLSNWTLSDGFGVRHVFPSGTVVPDNCAVVVFGGGAPTGPFGNSIVQTASSGLLGLNNGGDSITLNDGAADVVSLTYGGEASVNQSLTLDPDITGTPPYIQHSGAGGSGGALFSPGTRIDGSQFSGCAALPDPWVINEIHADPDSSGGDANGDGSSNFSQDEFVEIVNNTGGPVDISGWGLSDGFAVRHVFPSGTIVLDQCSVVVFGGGAPTGSFGNGLVQTASSGSLSLNNGGDSVTLSDGGSIVAATSYGGEGGDNQSLTLDPDITGVPPYVKHTVATGSGGALYSPGTRIDGSQFSGCPVVAEIFEIQGSGAASPFDGAQVTTLDNVVTAVRAAGGVVDGFFLQTPAARADGDIDTSDGIFVFTGGDPGVSVGDRVDVTGTVVEFFGLTEFNALPADVVIRSSGSPLPLPVALGPTVPSPDPLAPSCSIEFECYEGMLVEIAQGTVTGPNQRFNPDPVAEVHIVAAPDRAFREPGIEFPGLPGLPVWDGNPEVFELDPDKLGLPNQIIPAGSSFSAAGVIGFEFGGYELWPTELTVIPAPLPVPVRPRAGDEFTVASLNLFRLFDDVDDPADTDALGATRNDAVVSTAAYLLRRAKFTSYILEVLDAPDVLAVQEAEKLGVLADLAADIAAIDPSVVYTPYLIEGNDIGTIDVGFLVRDTIQVDAVTQLGYGETFVVETTGDVDLVHDRPPLLLEGSYLCDCDTTWDDQADERQRFRRRRDSDSDSDVGCSPAAGDPFKVIVVHNRSLGGIDSPTDGPRVRQKRLEQAQSIAQKVQDLQTADPGVRTLVVGDFNAFEFTDGYVDAVGQIKGDFEPLDNLLSGPDLVDPDLVNLVDSVIPAGQRYSFIFRGSAQVLDHALVSTGLASSVRGAEYGRGNADAAVDLINHGSVENLPLRSSDHDGLVVYLETGCARELKESAIGRIDGLLPTGDANADQYLEKARREVVKSLDSRLWIDGRRLQEKDGRKVFDREKTAVNELSKALDNGLSTEAEAEIAEAIAALLAADDLLAAQAIDDALAAVDSQGCLDPDPGEPCAKALHELDKALDSLAEARTAATGGDSDKAIDDYKKAWEHAGHAVKKLFS